MADDAAARRNDVSKEIRCFAGFFKRKIKSLERELKRKDQALAETVALLVLRKKYDALWEDPEDD